MCWGSKRDEHGFVKCPERTVGRGADLGSVRAALGPTGYRASHGASDGPAGCGPEGNGS